MRALDQEERERLPGAFTLVELVVVTVVLGILSALLLPALAAAKLKANQVKCMSNVRQLTLAGLMYADDQGKHASYNDPAYPGGLWMGSPMTFIKSPELRTCPTAPLRSPYPSRGNRQGTADRAWVRWTTNDTTLFYGSYGFNGWLYSDGHVDGLLSVTNQEYFFTRSTMIQKPALTPVFMDENWADLWPLEGDLPSMDLYNGSPFNEHSDEMGRSTICRHGGVKPASGPRDFQSNQKMPGAINMGLADGHAELAKLESLWTYSWHRDWQPPAKRPQ
jgi:type II secretory pathway pseudopilin PulG